MVIAQWRIAAPSVCALVALGWVLAAADVVRGDSISDFAVYSNQSVFFRGPLDGGLIGSGADVTLGAGSEVHGIRAVGDFTFEGTGTGSVDGDLIANASMSGGNGKQYTGFVQSQGNIVVPKNGFIGGNVVAGGNVTFENPSTVKGNVLANGNVSVVLNSVAEKDVGANGVLTVSSGGLIQGNATYGGSLSNSGTILGSQTHAPVVAAPLVFTPLVLPAATAFSAGGANVTGGALAPGSYGDLNVPLSGQVTLTAGDYLFKDIVLGKYATLRLDLTDGIIRVFVEGDVTMTDLRVRVSDDGGANYATYDQAVANSALKARAAQSFLETHGTLDGGNNSQWFGAIYAPDEGIQFLNGDITGALYGGGHINGDTNLLGINMDRCGSGMHFVPFVVPEPATLGLLAAGVVAALMRRRRRGR